MLAFHVIHPFPPTPNFSLTAIPRTQLFTHQLPLSPLRKKPPPTTLAGIPKSAAAAPLLPPENTNSRRNPSTTPNHNPFALNPPENNKRLKFAGIFGLCYLQNVIFIIYTKKALNFFPFPWLLASLHLLASSLSMAALWATNLHPFPRVNRKFFLALLTPAFFHSAGHIAACISFSKLAVSFTNVLKSSEPVFSVVLSALHGDFSPIHVWLSAIPIVAGCALAAATEASFTTAGLWGALVSNAGFALRNIYSKQSLYDFKQVDGVNLYGWISVVALFYIFPVAVVVEGRQWGRGWRAAVAAVGSPAAFCSWVVLSGVFYHLYNQSAYKALDGIDSLSFSIGETMKSVVVIVASVIAFRNPVGPLNAVGSAIAIFGSFLYYQAAGWGKKGEKKGKMVGC